MSRYRIPFIEDFGLKAPALTKADYQRLWWITEHFNNEVELQNAIQLILNAEGIKHVREYVGSMASTKSRADFAIPDEGYNYIALFIEAKIETKSTSFDRALGQALRNTVEESGKTWVVVPDDVKVTHPQIRSIRAIGGDIVRIGKLAERLSGFGTGRDPKWRDFGYLNQAEATKACVYDDDLNVARHMPQAHSDRYYRLRKVRRDINRVKALEA